MEELPRQSRPPCSRTVVGGAALLLLVSVVFGLSESNALDLGADTGRSTSPERRLASWHRGVGLRFAITKHAPAVLEHSEFTRRPEELEVLARERGWECQGTCGAFGRVRAAILALPPPRRC